MTWYNSYINWAIQVVEEVDQNNFDAVEKIVMVPKKTLEGKNTYGVGRSQYYF